LGAMVPAGAAVQLVIVASADEHPGAAERSPLVSLSSPSLG
jgi:hypothetical protein